MSSLLMKDKGCLLLSKKDRFPKLCHPVHSNQMVTLFFLGGCCCLNLIIFCPNFAREKEERLDGVWGKKASRKLSVISHVTNWIASNRKSVAIASDKPLSRETAGSWQTRGNLKGTEAFGCKLTLDIKHLTSFYFLGEKVFETQAICMYIQV